MSNAFAPRPFEEFDDDLDLDASYTTPGTPRPEAPDHALEAFGEPAADPRPALQFTAPAAPAAPVPAIQPVVNPQPVGPDGALAGFNPGGELGAGTTMTAAAAAKSSSSPPLSGVVTTIDAVTFDGIIVLFD